jgi:hypothetical protein
VGHEGPDEPDRVADECVVKPGLNGEAVVVVDVDGVETRRDGHKGFQCFAADTFGRE